MYQFMRKFMKLCELERQHNMKKDVFKVETK
jgi:hypothetical protein